MIIARLGEAGKWHVVRVTSGAGAVHTACNAVLRNVSSLIRTTIVETKNGEPTCKHCLRLRMKEII
jgi:hypothetical protein